MSNIEQLEELIDDADRLSFLCTASSPEFVEWRKKALNLLKSIYGEASEEVKKFKTFSFSDPQVLSFCTSSARAGAAVNICTHDLQEAKKYLQELKIHPNRRKQMPDAEKLQELIDETDQLIKHEVINKDPEFIKWHTKTERFLKKIYGEKSSEYGDFIRTSFTISDFPRLTTQSDFVQACARDIHKTKAMFEAYLEEMQEKEWSENSLVVPQDTHKRIANDKVFIVHGHNEGLKEALARLLEKQEIHPVILSEQANGGKTIIEKFEENSDVSAAICLFTADDEGKAKTADTYKARARQNVVFEAGYFAGKLGRDHLVILADNNIEIPSDLQGVVYSEANSWQLDVLKELNAMGFSIDFNKAFR